MITLKQLKEKLYIDGHDLYFEEEKNNEVYFTKCKTIPQAWHLFIPKILQREVGLDKGSNPSAFTAIFNGKVDNSNRGIEKKRNKLCICFTKKQSSYFKILKKYCDDLISNNISVAYYLKSNTKSNSVKKSRVLEFSNNNENGLEREFQDTIFRDELYNIFQIEFEVFLQNDQRIAKEIKYEIILNARENFAITLFWLIIFALFPTESTETLKEIQQIYLNKEIDHTLYDKYNFSLDHFLDFSNELLDKFTNTILACKTKWGPFSNDKDYQFTNMCEGLLAIDAANRIKINFNELKYVFLELEKNKNEYGLISKSLNEKTVVPTSMYLLIVSSLYNKGLIEEPCWRYAKIIAKSLWDSRNENGWGIYVKRHKNNTCNIGCTYWALSALKNYRSVISENELNLYSSKFFHFTGCYNYGTGFDVVCFNKPYLYSSAMMFTVFFDNGFMNNEDLASKYDYRKALEFILDNMFKTEFLSELEEIEGTDDSDKNCIRYVSWSHITLRYCMDALARAIDSGILSGEKLEDILKSLQELLDKYTYKHNHLLYYWKESNRLFDKEERGYIIFPTMHIMMGIASICNVLRKHKE